MNHFFVIFAAPCAERNLHIKHQIYERQKKKDERINLLLFFFFRDAIKKWEIKEETGTRHRVLLLLFSNEIKEVVD